MTRLIDYLKLERITALLTCLTNETTGLEQTDVDVSSLADTWLLLRDIELGGERNRAMYVLKARGIAHSNQIREFLLSENGIELADVYLGAAAALRLQQEVEARQRELDQKREALEARIHALRKEFEAEELEAKRIVDQETTRAEVLRKDRARMERSRKADRQ
jgi:circadian clock protein KaiC